MTCKHADCGCGSKPGSPACGLCLRSGLPLVLRVVLGGLFVLAALSKLDDPQKFAFGIDGFKLGLPDALTRYLAHALPWAELLAGALLVLGLFARGAALLIFLMLVAFAGGIASVMARGIEATCGCFGSLKLLCGDLPMGWCHLLRNALMAAAAVTIFILGPGMGAVDSLIRKPSAK